MLFLAVFLGFIAENIREHVVEKEREKQYMQSLLKDMKTDSATLTHLVQLHNDRHLMCDSLTTAFLERNFSNGSSIYYWGRSITKRQFFFSADGTIQQLKNSGALRLVSNRSIADQILAYDVLYRTLLNQQQLEETQLQDYRLLAAKIFDAGEFKKMQIFKPGKDATEIFITERPTGNPQLKDNSPDLLNDVVNKLNYWRAGSNFITFLLNQMREKATTLIGSLNKEYHLEQ